MWTKWHIKCAPPPSLSLSSVPVKSVSLGEYTRYPAPTRGRTNHVKCEHIYRRGATLRSLWPLALEQCPTCWTRSKTNRTSPSCSWTPRQNKEIVSTSQNAFNSWCQFSCPEYRYAIGIEPQSKFCDIYSCEDIVHCLQGRGRAGLSNKSLHIQRPGPIPATIAPKRVVPYQVCVPFYLQKAPKFPLRSTCSHCGMGKQVPVEFAWSHLPGSQWLTGTGRWIPMGTCRICVWFSLMYPTVQHTTPPFHGCQDAQFITTEGNLYTYFRFLGRFRENFPKSSALALQSATPQVATTHVLGCQATKPMMTAFTKMMRPMKESKKDEEINSCMLRRCLSSLGEVRPGVVLVVLQHLRVYVWNHWPQRFAYFMLQSC